ncbi:NADP-dependent oxidoreductase [Pedobacter sp. L105]|uniref:NADP-dependent oxidoreductase n=1 Tax=Pedobacter sp. L105 TaxID=1641871 RepID=UPI00131CD630|nr:NADP-dependent oxidoreductase [Pedobacter sp. L105]
MKAVTIHQYGSADELIYEDAQQPELKPNDVLVKIYATSINPIDWKVRGGGYPGSDQRQFPLILGWDVSGVIEKLGTEVTGFMIGDEVFGRPDTKRQGTYAEYVAVNFQEIARKPKSIDHTHTAAVPLAGLTAWQGIFDHGKLEAGQKILIHAAAGGVGTYAVQLAKWKGAYVIGTASESNTAFLMELGADEVIDYKNEDFSKKLKDIDVVFDLIGGEVQTKSLDVLKTGGILVSTVGIKDEEAVKAKGMIGVKYMAESRPENLKQLADLIDEGKLRPVIAEVLPLEQAKEAHKKSEKGHTKGKIVLQVVNDK